MTYDWLNPPAGTFTIEEYLKMHEYWMDSTSSSRNKLSLKANPLKKNFFGDKKVAVMGDMVRLEELHDHRDNVSE